MHGSYQSGIGVLDFSNRANAREIALADPAPLPLTSTGGTQHGGDWSSYFYNGYHLPVRHHAWPAHVEARRPRLRSVRYKLAT